LHFIEEGADGKLREGRMDDKERLQVLIERARLAVDSSRHLTTLATGVIALLGTLLAGLPRPLKGKALLAGALTCMVICVCFSLIHMFTFATDGPILGPTAAKIIKGTLSMTLGVFMAGVFLLGFFALVNLVGR
jgi:hypothetical protein